MSDSIVVDEAGRTLSFPYEAMLGYHGGGSPGGVALAFKVLERALPLLGGGVGGGGGGGGVGGGGGGGARVQRRELQIETAFGGPGARDGFELVTRAVTGGRYVVDPSLGRPELGVARERFVFRLTYRGRSVTLTLREGIVREEFIELTRREDRTAAEEARLTEMKAELAARVIGTAAPDVYDASG